MQQTSTFPDWHGTTILAVRKGGSTVIAGDGQVSMGQTIVKGNARKVRALAGGKVIAGFAGATADAFTLIERLEKRGSKVDYLDPFVPEIPMTREHADMAGRRSVAVEPGLYARYDAVLVCTDHDAVDYTSMFETARLIVDSRNVMGRLGLAGPNVIKA